MLLNEIFKGMFDPRSDKLVREISKLFYKTWAPKLHRDDHTNYDRLMNQFKDLSEKNKRGQNVTDKLERLRDVVAHASKGVGRQVKLRTGPGFYESVE